MSSLEPALTHAPQRSHTMIYPDLRKGFILLTSLAQLSSSPAPLIDKDYYDSLDDPQCIPKLQAERKRKNTPREGRGVNTIQREGA